MGSGEWPWPLTLPFCGHLWVTWPHVFFLLLLDSRAPFSGREFSQRCPLCGSALTTTPDKNNLKEGNFLCEHSFRGAVLWSLLPGCGFEARQSVVAEEPGSGSCLLVMARRQRQRQRARGATVKTEPPSHVPRGLPPPAVLTCLRLPHLNKFKLLDHKKD